MKRIQIIIVLLLIVACYGLKAQIGINIVNPIEIMHIDPKGDTSGSTNSSDDIVIISGGKVGIGTINPTANLDLRGSLKIVDDTQAANQVLTSNAHGVGSWQRTTMGVRVSGSVTGITDVVGGGIFKYSKVMITLPPGSWQINFLATYQNSYAFGANIWWDISTSSTTDNLRGRVLSCFSPSGGFIPVTATFFATHSTTTSYYLWAAAMNIPQGQTLYYSGQARIWGIKII